MTSPPLSTIATCAVAVPLRIYLIVPWRTLRAEIFMQFSPINRIGAAQVLKCYPATEIVRFDVGPLTRIALVPCVLDSCQIYSITSKLKSADHAKRTGLAA
ncbi:MAG: hypothetical protein L0Y50_02280 [Beijerinckiaceae bacterium]|nr:hypothetical protein [Beijerinckiaceae bacterium]